MLFVWCAPARQACFLALPGDVCSSVLFCVFRFVCLVYLSIFTYWVSCVVVGYCIACYDIASCVVVCYTLLCPNLLCYVIVCSVIAYFL